MKLQLFLLWLIALTVSALCLASLAPSRSSLSYTRYKLFELAMQSDIAVYGTISALQDTTFDLQCERSVIGPKIPAVLRVQRFEDWTCASRWSQYAVGQRVLLFLRKPSADWPYPIILGSGGEGEIGRDQGNDRAVTAAYRGTPGCRSPVGRRSAGRAVAGHDCYRPVCRNLDDRRWRRLG
jgi:hypothetical protein